MSIRVPFILLVPFALVGCAHNASESVAATPTAAGSKSPAPKASGVAEPGKLVDEGPASAAAAAGAAATPSGGGQLVPFQSSGGFTVLMPANPVQENRTEQTPGGQVQIHVAQASDPAAQYVSTYSEFPPGTLEKVKTASLLDAFQRSTLQATNGTLVRSRDIQVDGLPGREFTSSSATGGQMTARLMVAPGRVYTLAGTYPQGETPASVERFLGSFARTASGGPGVGGSGPVNESSGTTGTVSDPRTPVPEKRPGAAPRGTEVPAGTADPSGQTPTR